MKHPSIKLYLAAAVALALASCAAVAPAQPLVQQGAVFGTHCIVDGTAMAMICARMPAIFPHEPEFLQRGNWSWRGHVRVPAGHWQVHLEGHAKRSIGMIDNAVLAPAGVHAVQGPRSVILTGPALDSAQLNWSGRRIPYFILTPAQH